MSMSSTDKGLLTPQNCAVIFIDYQPQMLSVLPSQEQRDLLDNLLLLAKAAQMFGVPVILTAIESKDFSGDLPPQLQQRFPDQIPLKRSSMNAWDDSQFVSAVRQTGRRNFLLAGLWSEACLAFPALQMLEEGFGIYVVKDASGGTNRSAHDTALRRVEQAGGVSLTALQVMLEFQRDWAKAEHSEEVMALVKARCREQSRGAERHSLVDGVPTNRKPGASKGTGKRKAINE
jgi:nicotinamidase-related amidase